MTMDFSTPYSPTGVNIYGSAITTSAGDEFQRQTWRQLPSPDPKKYRVMELTVWDLRNGWGQRGQLIKTASSTLDQRYGLTLPPLVSQTDHGGTSTPQNVLCHTYFGSTNQLAIGHGGTANLSLFKETSATNPVLVALTYSPGAAITCLSPIIIGGASTAEQMVVGKASTAAEVLGDLTPTSTGNMHALTATMQGNVLSPINAAAPGTPTNIFMAGSNPATLYSLASTSAIGTAPTALLTNLPSGGVLFGIEQLQKNWPLRIYGALPFQSLTAGSMFETAPYPGKAVSFNLEGTDPLDVPLGIRILGACGLWNRTVVGTDGVRIVSYDGEQVRDLHFLKGRERDTTFRWGCTGLAVWGGDLYAIATRSDLAASGTNGNSVVTCDKFIPEFDAWVPTTGAITLAGTLGGGTIAPYGLNASQFSRAPMLPVSRQSAYLHMMMYDTALNTRKSDRFFLSPEGVNPFEHYNGAGGANNLAQAFAASGTMTSSEFPVPGAGRNPTVLYEIDATQADVAAGGSDSTFEVEWAAQSTTGASWTFTNNLSATFKGSEPQAKLVKNFWQNTSSFTQGKFRINATRSATTTRTGNYVPITFRFITYLGGQVDAAPIAVLGGMPA